MDLETANYLLSSDGECLLQAAESMQGSLLQRITTLRKHYPAPFASAAIELIDLRRRASRKFSRASEMLFTREALEQSSGETVSRYRAERYPVDCRVLDLACGIGGDTIGLASRAFVTAVDSDPVRIAMARRNIEVYGLGNRVEFICADVQAVPLDVDAAFLDPSRRSGGRRSTSLREMSPPLEYLHELVRTIPNSAVKLSPATNDDELESLAGEIEFISDSGECKEALVWFGGFKTTTRRATVLPERATLIRSDSIEIPVVPLSKYLYEPDPCIIRAHLVGEAANEIGASRIDEHIAYLTSEQPVHSPYVRGYEIIDSMPFNLKALNRRLNELDAGKVIVKKRGVPYTPEEIEGRLKLKGNLELVVVLTRIGDKAVAVICLPIR